MLRGGSWMQDCSAGTVPGEGQGTFRGHDLLLTILLPQSKKKVVELCWGPGKGGGLVSQGSPEKQNQL